MDITNQKIDTLIKVGDRIFLKNYYGQVWIVEEIDYSETLILLSYQLDIIKNWYVSFVSFNDGVDSGDYINLTKDTKEKIKVWKKLK